jgi:hypothetical protein
MTRARDVANIDGILTTKGDIYAATAASTPARLGVGSNGETIVADSSTSTGLRYQATQAAGRNIVINGGFDIWQRGTSFTLAAATNTYTSDRWLCYRGVTGMTVTRQSSGLTGFQYAIRAARDSGNTSTTALQVTQSIETSNSLQFAGQTITVSFYARAGANYSAASSNLSVYLKTGTGTDQNYINGFTGDTNIVNGSTATLTTTWQRFSFTATAGSTATQLGIGLVGFPTGTAGANDYFEVTGVQLELGSVPTTFTRAGGSIQGELAACQRYYQRWTGSPAAANWMGSGAIMSSTSIVFPVLLPYQMRTAPTMAISAAADLYFQNALGVGSPTSVVFDTVSFNGAYLRMTTSGQTAGYAAILGINTGSTKWIEASSEL